MEESTRHRISGSIFLLALAVIFVPMLFDGGRHPNPEIPPAPADVALAEPTRFEDIVPDTEVVAEVTELRAEVDSEGFVTRGGNERFGHPRLTEEGAETSVWAVQAASFKELDNAQGLRRKLKEQGLEAFIASIKHGDVVMHRVAVGPLLSRADGEQIQQRVNKAFDLKAQIVAMEP